MKIWDYVYISDYYDYQSGLSKPASDFGFGYPFLSFSEIFNNSFIPSRLRQLVNSNTNEQKSCSIKKGDVFLTRTSETIEELGMSCVALKEYPNATFNGFTKRLRPNASGIEKVYPLYIGYYLRSIYFRGEITAYSNPTTRASLNNGILNKLKILLPPLPIQRKIAAILSAYDELIENNNRRIAILEKMAEEIYRKWFVRLRFPGHENVKVVKGVPEGWEVKTLSDVADVIDCLHTKKPDNTDSGSGWLLQLENIGENGRFDTNCKYMINASDYDEWTKNIEVTEGDCLITNVGRIAAVAQIPKDVKAAIGRNMTAVRPRKIPACYLIQYLLSPHMQNEVQRKQDFGAIMGALNVRAIKKLEIILPSIKIMNDFINILNPIRQGICNLTSKNTILKTTRDLLLPRLISGKLDVENLDITFPPGMEEEALNA